MINELYNIIELILPSYVGEYFPYEIIVPYIFLQFLTFYPKKWFKEFQGSSEVAYNILGAYIFILTVLEYALVLLFIFSIDIFSLQIWATGASLLIVVFILSLVPMAIEVLVFTKQNMAKVAILSLIGLIINPILIFYVGYLLIF